MASTNAASGGWRCVAVFDVDAHAPIVDGLRGNAPDSCYLILPARESPPGMRRFEIHVDYAIGEDSAARLAQAQVDALRQWVAAGMMPGYRLVSGREWVRPATAAPRVGRRLAGVSSARDLD